MAGKGFTDKGNRITPTSPFDWDTGAKLSAGEGAGTSDTTEATQLLVKAAVETTATNSTALAKSEDAAHASGDKGIMALVVRKDTATALAGADGDYAPLEVDASGRLWVNVGTMAALPAGANNIGDVDVLTLPALVAGSAIIGKVGIDQTTPGTTNGVVIKDSAGNAIDQSATVNVAQDVNAMKNGATTLTPKYAKIAASASGNNTLIAAVTGKKIRVLAYNFMGAGAVNAKFQDGAGGTDLTGLKYIAAAGGGICAPFNPVGWFETTAATLLNLNLSGAVGVGGEITYVEV